MATKFIKSKSNIYVLADPHIIVKSKLWKEFQTKFKAQDIGLVKHIELSNGETCQCASTYIGEGEYNCRRGDILLGTVVVCYDRLAIMSIEDAGGDGEDIQHLGYVFKSDEEIYMKVNNRGYFEVFTKSGKCLLNCDTSFIPHINY